MSKLYEVKLSTKEKKKLKKFKNKRLYSSLDIAIIKHDIALRNSQIKRGELEDKPNYSIIHCGCGAQGCFLHIGHDNNFENRNQPTF